MSSLQIIAPSDIEIMLRLDDPRLVTNLLLLKFANTLHYRHRIVQTWHAERIKKVTNSLQPSQELQELQIYYPDNKPEHADDSSYSTLCTVLNAHHVYAHQQWA